MPARWKKSCDSLGRPGSRFRRRRAHVRTRVIVGLVRLRHRGRFFLLGQIAVRRIRLRVGAALRAARFVGDGRTGRWQRGIGRASGWRRLRTRRCRRCSPDAWQRLGRRAIAGGERCGSQDRCERSGIGFHRWLQGQVAPMLEGARGPRCRQAGRPRQPAVAKQRRAAPTA